MTLESGQVPVAATLSAKIIRACSVHQMCALTCPQRRVEDLGQIASFDTRPPPEDSFLDRLKEGLKLWRR